MIAFGIGSFLGAVFGVGILTRLIKWALKTRTDEITRSIIASIIGLLFYTNTNCPRNASFFSYFIMYTVATLIWLTYDLIKARKSKSSN